MKQTPIVTQYRTEIKNGHLELISVEDGHTLKQSDAPQIETPIIDALRVPIDFVIQTIRSLYYSCRNLPYQIIDEPYHSIGRIVRT